MRGKALGALIAWRWSGGDAQCAGCADTPEFACRRYGGRGACPQDENPLRSFEAAAIFAAFDLVQSQLRMGFSGPVGLDLPAALTVFEALGVDRGVAALLLPAAERGLMQAFGNMRDGGKGSDAPRD